MKHICVIAINRAKHDAADACVRLALEFDLDIKAYMLVSDTFRNTSAYRGDETKGYFTEIVLNFDDNDLLQKTVDEITTGSDSTITHCLVESAMHDYAKIIPMLPNSYTQTPESVILSSEKSKMRTAMKALYPEISPNFIILNSFEEFNEKTITGFNFPVIIKPNGLSSSLLVTKCESYDEVIINLKKTFNAISTIYAREHGAGDMSVVIEEFIVGDLYSIDAYVADDNNDITYLPPVRVITSYDVGLPGFYGHERIVPTTLSSEETENANECVRKTVQSLGLKNSTIHAELYKTTNGWKTVELGPRIGGYRQELYKEAFGIEHFYNDFLVHYGKKPIITIKQNNYASAINIYPESEGIITEIIGLEEARKVQSLIMLKQHSFVGDTASFAINGGKFVVDAIFANKDETVLRQDMEAVRSLIKIKISDDK